MDKRSTQPSTSNHHSSPPYNEEDFYLNNDDEDEEEEEDEDMNDDEDMSEMDEFADRVDDMLSKSSGGRSENKEIGKTSSSGATSSSSAEKKSSVSLLSKSSSEKRGFIDPDADEFKYEVLTPDKIVQYMIECIKDVNQVLELTSTTTRILLHHFRWDKEKLMERFYDGDPDRLFNEAHVVNPFKKNSNKRANLSVKTLITSLSWCRIL